MHLIFNLPKEKSLFINCLRYLLGIIFLVLRIRIRPDLKLLKKNCHPKVKESHKHKFFSFNLLGQVPVGSGTELAKTWSRIWICSTEFFCVILHLWTAI